MLAIFDASTVVAAAITADGLPFRALVAASERGGIALSAAVFDEIQSVLARPKFTHAFGRIRIDAVLRTLTSASTWFHPTEVVTDCRDTADNKYLELAAACVNAVIVSGDADLLALDPWRTTRIMMAREFLAQLDRQSGRGASPIA